MRRSDFSAQVASKLDVTYKDPYLYIEGYADLRRGFFDLFGKRFELSRGTMNFDGSSELNPELNLQATHEVASSGGTLVTISVGGRLRAPKVDFTSNHPDCREQSQVIDLLISGRCASGQNQSGFGVAAAEQQAASFLAGLTAGILTLGARREFGELVPVISIETGQSGFSSTRARLGFQADTIIPPFMKSVVRGAYIEGAFPLSSAQDSPQIQQQQLQQQGAGTRFLLELQFPYDFVGTTRYWPPSTFGLDLTWEP
ncbi:MAG: translocation/assembly module TamB domain-containing protein [Myxococcales bacterium]|nr:MAG: translocation/assembly module TamB domain-containing protein [Myxococcales bacterium]